MSRKPPKLAPVEGKETVGSGNGRTSQSAPHLKQGGNVGASGSNAATSTPRRASLTRNYFLNCNGSSNAPSTRRRFPPKFPSAATIGAAPSTVNSVVPSADNDTASNGCADEKSHNNTSPVNVNSTNKVNGTISNGLTSSQPNEPPSKFVKRSKSLGVSTHGTGSVISDIQRGSVTVNGKKAEVNCRTSVSNSISSQNKSAANVTKRTSRFSQSSAVVPRPNKDPSSVPPTSTRSIEEKTMPALVACEPPTISKENPPVDEEQDESGMESCESISEEPKIIKKGDTVIKSYVDEKTGKISVFERGMKLEVCDFGSGKWYPAKVMSIEREKQEVLVHYSNWSSRYDEWISMKSTRIRPGKNTNVVSVQFAIGERVEAVWPADSRKYAGTITQKLPQDGYEITFDDGIKMKRSAHQIFKVSNSEEEGISEDGPPRLVTCLPEASKDSPITTSSPVQTPKTLSGQRTKKRSVKSQSAMPTPIPNKLSVSETPTVIASPAVDLHDSSPNRHHFSVFDLPQGELGKRKRTVHDYSALVKGKQGQRGPRRPKSEGSSIASSPTTLTPVTDETSTSTTVELLTPKANTTSDTTEPGSSDTKRRQKPESTPQVPTVQQPSSEEPKELPLVEPVLLEPLPIPEQTESPTKKRKQPSTNTTVDTKVPPKVETVSQLGISPVLSNIISTNARRTKSLGTVQLGMYPPLIDTDTPKDTKVDSGFVNDLGKAIIIEQNSDDGFWKCPLDKCGKNFRKDSLLKMHFKHYHPELKVANARGIANVVQMAQARTAFDNDPTDYHVWPKHSISTEPVVSTEIVPLSTSETSDVSTKEVTDIPVTHKKTSKTVHQAKHSSPEKVSPVASHIEETPSSTILTVKSSEDPTSELTPTVTRSPRLRLSRKRNFVLTKYGRIRSPKKQASSVPTQNEEIQDKKLTDVITTESCKKPKNSETVPQATYSETGDESSFVASPISSLLSTSNTPSPSVSDQFSVESCSGSSSGDAVFPTLNSQPEPQLVSCNSRTLKGRWSKHPLRRGLMSGNLRRVGTASNSTSLFLKKRMQYRKFYGKRGSRQKRVSILTRISSGRMRVILDALNQRSLKRKRFRAARRYRDVKVDVINCVCSSKTEFGLMIQCELCLCWQHGSCFNVQSNSQLPDFYACQSCSEPEKVRLSRKYEWAESEFYRLGKLPSFPFAPSFSKEDARIMKMCTNLSSNLIETYSMIKGLKVKERICFGQPEHPQLYEWNTERAPPQEEIQRDRFNKYFKPVLRRLLLENKSDPAYHSKLRKLAEARMKLRKYSDAVESARSTLKKKLGCRAAAFLNHICDRVLNFMVRAKRKTATDDSGHLRKDNFDLRRRLTAEQAYQRLRKIRDEVTRRPNGPTSSVGVHDDKFASFDDDAATTSKTSNGMRKDAALNVKDYCLLKRYLKGKRTTDANISLTLNRMSKEFPDDWKNLMKVSRVYIEENRKEIQHEAKLKWIASVIVTYNTLRILLRQIYSENNLQKQRNLCSDFEKTTIKLFDLFGIGLAEERLEVKKQHASTNQRKRVRGLETLDMLNQTRSPGPKVSTSKFQIPLKDLDNARKEILKRLGSSSKHLSNKDVEDLLTTASETKRLDEAILSACSNSSTTTSLQNSIENKPSTADNTMSKNTAGAKSQSTDMFLRARHVDGQIAFEFNQTVNLVDSVKFCAIAEDECTEENLSLEFPSSETQTLPSTHSGIIAVPADSKITPDVCRKNLVRDLILQQQQIDVYLDKIEAQIIKLSSQSKTGESVTSVKPVELSAQRTRMIHSLELVSRLSKTLIGENDIVEPEQSEDMDVSETTLSDYSDMDLSSESDGFDNASNYSGTDTETADEGDITGDDDLLDV